MILMVLPVALCGETQQEAIKRGKEFTKTHLEKVKNTFDSYDKELFSTDEEFDPENAKRAIKSEDVSETEISNLVKDGIINLNNNSNLHSKDEIFRISDELTNEYSHIKEEMETFEEFEYKKCRQNGSPYQLSYIRTLNVQVSEASTGDKTCSGHHKKKKYYWESDAEKEAEKQKKKLREDKTIKSFNVEISGGGTFSSYRVNIDWWHIKNASLCDQFTNKERESGKEIDSWKHDDENKYQQSKTHNCNFTHSKCLDDTPSKMINGKEVLRKCWMENLYFLCRNTEKEDCGFLVNRNCSQVDKKCIQNGHNGCALWELTFKCGGKVRLKKADDVENISLEELWEVEYEPNDSFSDAYTKLKVFEEIQKEIKSNSTIDHGNVHIFKGLDRKCAKNVSSYLMYDCCHTMEGLATDAKLTKCSSDELELAEMREKGLCHYVGSYEEKFLELWKSRDNHVFCCFHNKLSKVVQEQIREQLEIGWGSEKHPMCRGLSVDEITKADFSKLDLSEAFTESSKNIEGNKERLDAFTNRLKDILEKESSDDDK